MPSLPCVLPRFLAALVLTSAALSNGCSVQGPGPDNALDVLAMEDIEAGQGEAVRIILQTFAQQGPGPVVRWQRRLDCAVGTGWRYDAAGPCVRGIHREGEVTIAIWPGADLAQTSLAHEICHWTDWVRGGDGDPDHLGPCFGPDGLVEQANTALWQTHDPTLPAVDGVPSSVTLVASPR
jgi:hypothetical protein